MAIEAIGVTHEDLEVRGGLKHIAIGEFGVTSAVTFDSAAGDHHISALTNGGMKLFELKQGTGSLTTTGTKEGGTIMFENTVTFYVPRISDDHLAALYELANKDLICIVEAFEGTKYVVGVSEEYKLSTDVANNQMYARMTSIEGGTGAALGDENGVTVTITAMSGELPRTYTGTYNPNPSGGTVALT